MSRRQVVLAITLILVSLCVGLWQQTTWANEAPFLQLDGNAPSLDDSSGRAAGAVEAEWGPLVDQSLANYAALPEGLVPFLNKPFGDTYTAPVKLHSFFDHRLPIYSKEAVAPVPEDIRDANESITLIFTGEERTAGGQGANTYSGHDGLDYGDRLTSISLVVTAPADGVIAAAKESKACRVWINHDASTPPDNHADYATYYTHLSAIGEAPPDQRTRIGRDPDCGIYWCKGDTIAKGQVIGTEGNDPCGGKSTGVHLHFGVAAGALDGAVSPINVDPFGWWSNDADPWADARLAEHETSYWLWAAPTNPGPGAPGYWGDDVAAQTDDVDASFHRFTAITREEQWVSMLDDPGAGVDPIGAGAWRSPSLANNSGHNESWAIWALHVPENATYRLQVHIPDTPANVAAPTATAHYQVRIPVDGGLNVWQARDVDQNRSNEWVDLTTAEDVAEFALEARDVVLISLGDVTGHAGESVLFDAVRLYRLEPGEPPLTGDLRRVGFAVDNSSSMQAQGKINVVRSAVPAWIDLLEMSADSYTYALAAFADNVPPVKVTEDPATMKTWIAGLHADDNGVPNSDCPEASLAAIRALAHSVVGGNLLLFTDDLPKNPLVEGPVTAVVLAGEHVRMHAIILPKTCSGGSSIGWLAYRALALTTGGTYQTVSTDKTDEALQIVLAQMEANVELATANDANATYANGALHVVAAEATHTIVVDPTVTEALFLLNTLEGNFSLALYRPDGSLVNSADSGVTFIDSGSAKFYKITNPPSGTWRADVTGTGEYLLRSSGKSEIEFTYLGDTYVSKGEIMQLAARVSGPVSNLAFALETPEGQPVATVPMVDNGTSGDYSAGDGVYAGIYIPNQDTDLRMRATGTTAGGQPFVRSDSSLIRLTSVSVAEPESATVPVGDEYTFEFKVTNTSGAGDSYRLTASSSQGWIMTGPASQIYLNSGETKTVLIRTRVPEDATPNSIDVIRLTAVHSEDAADLSSGSTNIFVPDIDGSDVGSTTLFLPVSLQVPYVPPALPLLNGNFEAGPANWTQSSTHNWPLIVNSDAIDDLPTHSGIWIAWLGGDDNETSIIEQAVTVPADRPYLTYYYGIASKDSCGYDFGRVLINGLVVEEYTLCRNNNTPDWAYRVINLSAYAGQTVALQFRATTDGSLNSNLLIDDVAFNNATAVRAAPVSFHWPVDMSR